jgi:hypothetical protein
VIADLVCSRRMLDERGKIRCLPPVVSGLCVPFAVCVDFLGYRIFASTLLPIGAGTLVYGSQDGGKTTLNSDPAAVQLAATVAQHLNLKTHNVGRKCERSICLVSFFCLKCLIPAGHKEMHLAADVELHRGRDGRMWIVDRTSNPFFLFFLIFLSGSTDAPVSSGESRETRVGLVRVCAALRRAGECGASVARCIHRI